MLYGENLEGYFAPHHDVLAEKDLPHAAGAKAFEKSIFTGDDEPAPAARDELLGLEMG